MIGKRILLTTIGSLGDLHPLLAIGLGLRARGHQVSLAATAFYRPKIEALGFGFHPLRPELPANDAALIAYLLDLKRGPERLLREVLFPSLRDSYLDLLAATRNVDFMLAGELVYAAPLVAEKTGLAWTSYVTSPMSFFSAHDPPVVAGHPWLAKLRALGATVNRALITLADARTRSWAKPLRELRRELGLAPKRNPILRDKYSPNLVLAGFSPSFAKAQPDWPRNTVITGFTFYDGRQEGVQLGANLETFLDAGEAPIVFTLGSAAVYAPGTFYVASAEAATELGRRAILLMGDNAPPAGLPAHVIACAYAPYSDLFPRACAIVHSGGIGTVAQALRAGRPSIVTPFAFDQPDNAARLERLGTSRTIPRGRYTVARAAAALTRLLGESRYRERAAEIGRALRHEDGVRIACDAIEQQLHGRR
jgi:rhamnosyltransferase subunit B